MACSWLLMHTPAIRLPVEGSGIGVWWVVGVVSGSVISLKGGLSRSSA